MKVEVDIRPGRRFLRTTTEKIQNQAVILNDISSLDIIPPILSYSLSLHTPHSPIILIGTPAETIPPPPPVLPEVSCLVWNGLGFGILVTCLQMFTVLARVSPIWGICIRNLLLLPPPPDPRKGRSTGKGRDLCYKNVDAFTGCRLSFLPFFSLSVLLSSHRSQHSYSTWRRWIPNITTLKVQRLVRKKWSLGSNVIFTSKTKSLIYLRNIANISSRSIERLIWNLSLI